MVERDLDDDEVGQNNFAVANNDNYNMSAPQTDHKMNDTLGMDGVDIELEDYDKQPQEDEQRGQGNVDEETKEKQQSNENSNGLKKYCFSLEFLVPYF